MQLRPVSDLGIGDNASAAIQMRAIQQTTPRQAAFRVMPLGTTTWQTSRFATAETVLREGFDDGNVRTRTGFRNFGDNAVNWDIQTSTDPSVAGILVIYARNADGEMTNVITRIFVVSADEADPEPGDEIILIEELRRDADGFSYRALTSDDMSGDAVVSFTHWDESVEVHELANMERWIITLSVEGDDIIADQVGEWATIVRVTANSVLVNIAGVESMLTVTDDTMILSRGRVGGALNRNDTGYVFFSETELEVIAISVDRPDSWD
jgi:hypothetical protein